MRKRKDIKGETVKHGEEYGEIIELTDVVEEYPQTSPAWEESFKGQGEGGGESFTLDEDGSEEAWDHDFELNGDRETKIPDECGQQKIHRTEELDVKIVEGIIKEVSREITEKFALRIAPDIIAALVEAMDEKMENIAQKLFPPMAEKMIHEEIKKLKAGED